MKKMVINVAFIATLALISIHSIASEIQPVTIEYNTSNIKTETFKVYGNCGMCKKTIEASLQDVKGVTYSNWNEDSKMMEVKFNEEEISLDEIKKLIASVGYDTEEHRASDKVYNNLSGCCQYERPDEEMKKEHNHKGHCH